MLINVWSLSFAEAAFANVGGVLQVATAEMSGISSSKFCRFWNTCWCCIIKMVTLLNKLLVLLITGGANADLSSDFTQTTENIKVVNFTDATLSTAFTQTVDGIKIASGVVTKDLNFTKTTSGDILYVAVTTDATTETYTEVTPSGTETWTEITPSGAETWTEIEA